MSWDNKNLDETVEAILSLKKSAKCCFLKDAKEFTAMLVGADWKYFVRSTFFEVRDSGCRVVCEFLGFGKIWILRVEDGCAAVDEHGLGVRESTNLRERSVVRVGSLQFRFSSLQRVDKFQKSYKKIISEAIRASAERKLSLSEIYRYFEINYGFLREASVTWKNSIRHNLSINEMFQRVPRNNDFSHKGMLWTVVDDDLCDASPARRKRAFFRETAYRRVRDFADDGDADGVSYDIPDFSSDSDGAEKTTN